MPPAPAAATSQRLLALLSVLQTGREWSAPVLAERLAVSARTVRRDVDRLRELGYAVETTRGPDGGYRLSAGARLPPLLFDEQQAEAMVIALRTAGATAVDAVAAERALRTLTRLMPARLAQRVSALEAALGPGGSEAGAVPVAPDVLLRVGEAIVAEEELRFDYASSSAATERAAGPPRRTQPHHVLLSSGRWYLIGWTPESDDWRIYRVDRMALRQHRGARFARRAVPGGSPAAYLAARFKGSSQGDAWPCLGSVVLAAPVERLQPFVRDGVIERLDDERSRYSTGSWSWTALAAQLGRFGVDIADAQPDALRDAFGELSDRFARAAGGASARAPRAPSGVREGARAGDRQ